MQKKQKAHYIKNICRIRDWIEIEKHYPGRFGAPGQKREPKKKRTPEEMAKQNFWRKCRDLARIIALNFNGSDWYITLTCKKELRPSREEAPKVIREFRDRIREEYKKRGWVCKYIITCETGDRGAVHWNLILNNMSTGQDSTARLIRQHWKLGRPNFKLLDEKGDYQKLAEYIVKETKKRIEEEKTIEKLSYISSRNLLRPVVEPQKVYARKWLQEPKAPKGYYVVPESVVNGINLFTGNPYQHYTIRKIPRGKENSGQWEMW